MKFALILTLFTPEGPNYWMNYAVETDLSALECEVALAKHQALLELTFQAEDIVLTCEMDDAHED